MTHKKRTFNSTDHLSPEAIAAFADDELTTSALHRARVHVVQCDECRREVNQQRAVTEKLRYDTATSVVCAPASLVRKLSQMPDELAQREPQQKHDVKVGDHSSVVEMAYRALKYRG